MVELREPKQQTFYDQSGKPHEFILSKFDAIAGREIIAKYLMSNMPKIGDYAVSEEIMLKLMSYVAIPLPGTDVGYQRLITKQQVINFVPDWEMLGHIEKAMVEYNASFFQAEKISTFFEDLAQKFIQKIFAISTQSSGQSLPPESQPSKSSEPSTP